jgi:hypothetical protein
MSKNPEFSSGSFALELLLHIGQGKSNQSGLPGQVSALA